MVLSLADALNFRDSYLGWTHDSVNVIAEIFATHATGMADTFTACAANTNRTTRRDKRDFGSCVCRTASRSGHVPPNCRRKFFFLLI